MEHELIGKMVTWTSRGVVKTGEIIAAIYGFYFPVWPDKLIKENNITGFWKIENIHKNCPALGQAQLQSIVEQYQDSHSIQFGYQKPTVYNQRFGTYVEGNPFTGLKRTTSFVIEVKDEGNPDHYKPRLYHPYPKNLRPVED